jgi:cell division protein FtsZ
MTLDEMTEASDRIYDEVGDEADIIWGQAIDETLGDEMRVTVIATGIGPAASSFSKSSSSCKLRGKIRDVTPEDLESAENFDEPTFIRQQQAVGESYKATYRGFKGIVLDNDDLDVPTFLRRKAD